MIPQNKKYSYIHLRQNNNITFSANTGGTLPLDGILNKSEDDFFERDGSAVKCNFDGIIIVNASINFTYRSGANYAYIYKNDVRVTNNYLDATIVTTNFAMPVQKGDKITLQYYSSVSNNIGTAENQTFLNIVRIS